MLYSKCIMKKDSKLHTWQIVLIVIGALLVFGPGLWDALTAFIETVLNIRLEDIMTRTGMFFIGLVLLGVVGLYELVSDSTNKPKSKYIK